MCSASSVIRELPSPGSTDPEDLVVLAGLTVVDTDDDDPVLLWPDGTPVDTWREDYPYDERMSRDYYERTKRLLQIELVKLQNWVKDRAADHHRLRGPRRRGQRRHDQALHRAPEPARGDRRGAGKAVGARADPVVLPAVRDAPARRGRDRDVRQVLVQPGRGRAGHEVCHAGRIRRVHARGAGIRADAGALRAVADEVLVLRVA